MAIEQQIEQCPDEQELQLILSGDCSRDHQELVEQHLSVCSVCVEKLELLSVRDADYISAHLGPKSEPIGGVAVDTDRHSPDTLNINRSAEPSVSFEHEAFSAPDIPGYQVVELIARGGMGLVYRANAIELQRQVAIKMILGGLMAGPERIHRFEKEAKALAKLDHPNIVRIYEVGSHQGQPYFAMEYVNGESLQQVFDGTPWSPRRAAKFVKSLSEAIEVAHRHDVIHRDLKPANILIDCNQQEPDFPRIIDFGLAKDFDQEEFTKSGEIFGSPSYMSPEQASGDLEQIGVSTDVYSLGCILYELLTGRPPFVGTTVPETLHQIVSDEPVRLRLMNSSIPKDLETICLKCVEKPTEKRYSNASALTIDLDNFLTNRPINARPASGAERVWKFGRRHPAWTTAAAVLLIALSGLLLMWAKFTTDLATQTQLAMSQKKIAVEKEALAVKNEGLAIEQAELAKRNEEMAIRNFKRAEEQLEIQQNTYLFTTFLVSNLNKLSRSDDLVKLVLDSEKEFDHHLRDEPLKKAAYLSAVALTLHHIAEPKLALEKIDESIRLFQDLNPFSIQCSHAHVIKILILYQLDWVSKIREVRTFLDNDQMEIHEFDRHLLDFIDASLLIKERKFTAAEELLNRFLQVDDLNSVDSIEYRGKAYGLMGIIKIKLKQFSEAANYFQRHLEVVKETNGEDSEVFLRAQSRMAFTLMKSGTTQKAIELFDLVLEKCIKRFGEDHFTTLEVMINSALANSQGENYEYANELNQKAAKLALKRYGQKHVFSITALRQIATNAIERESQADALDFMLEHVDQKKLKRQRDYFSVALMVLTARLFLDTQDFDQAKTYAQLASERVRSKGFKVVDQGIYTALEKLERELAEVEKSTTGGNSRRECD